MIIFLYGSDGYRLKQNTKKVIASYTSKYPSGLNLFEFDFLDTDTVDNLENALKSSSFFNEFKLVTIKNFFNKKGLSAKIEELIVDHQLVGTKDIILLAVENLKEADLTSKNRGLFKLLSQNTNTVKSFEPLPDSRLSQWLHEEFKQRNKTIEQSALHRLVDIVGNNTWPLINEVEKLANYSHGTIKEVDVQTLVTPRMDLNIFDLIDALAAKNKVLAVKLLYQEMATGRDPYYVLSMMIYQFRNILLVKSLGSKNGPSGNSLAKSGLHPFVVKKISKNIANFSEGELRKIYQKLLVLDTESKNGAVNLKDSLSRFILTSV